jgi:hypothetical protein
MKFIYAFIYANHDLFKQGFQEQIIGSAREILDMVDKVKVAAKSEPENLGHRVSYKVKVAAKFEPENIGHKPCQGFLWHFLLSVLGNPV